MKNHSSVPSRPVAAMTPIGTSNQDFDNRDWRSGTVSVVVLIVLLLLSLLLLSQAKRILTERRQQKTELQYVQACQVAEAGLLRAAQKFSAAEEYHGEVWSIPTGVIHDAHTAEVRITVDDSRHCVVVARYPSNQLHPVQVTRTKRLSP